MSDASYYSIELKETLVRNTKNWFPEPTFSAGVLAAHILMAAFFFGAKSVNVRHDGDWWGVFADVDWFAISGVTLDELLSRVVPFPGLVNSMRPETWLTAYAADVSLCNSPQESTPHELRNGFHLHSIGLVYRIVLPADRP